MGLVGDYRLHDSVIKNIENYEDKMTVELLTTKKDILYLDFNGIKEINSYKTDNMFIYSVIHEAYDDEYYNVVFVNWYSKGEEGGDSKFEIICRNWILREGS